MMEPPDRVGLSKGATRTMDYFFFFSYAHADDNEYMRKFYQDLDGEVRQLTGAPATKIGFLDRQAIEHGSTWDAELEKGLRCCKVFVPMYSLSYFRAPYCGKEFAVFRDRLHSHLKNTGAAVSDSLILPVLWSPESNVLPQLPDLINKIQYTHGGYPEAYAAEGVSQMLRLGVAPTSKFHNEYWEFVRKLANAIDRASKNLTLPALTTALPSLDSYPSLFPQTQPVAVTPGGAGPRYVQFIFVAGNQPELRYLPRTDLRYYGAQGGADWQPYLDAYKGNAAALAIETLTTYSRDLNYEEVATTPDLLEQVRRSTSEGKIVVVLVDTWTLRIPKYSELVSQLDNYSSVNCITVIVWNDDDEESKMSKGLLEAAVQGALGTKVLHRPPNFLWSSIKSYDTFKAELIKALGQSQNHILETAKMKKNLKYTLIKITSDDLKTTPSF